MADLEDFPEHEHQRLACPHPGCAELFESYADYHEHYVDEHIAGRP